MPTRKGMGKQRRQPEEGVSFTMGFFARLRIKYPHLCWGTQPLLWPTPRCHPLAPRHRDSAALKRMVSA
jgi:hypothetical protein